MSDALPPLTALRAFDAAARHMSFAKAAEELHVTPAALSYQIKSLEAHLGTPLFRRLNRAVELTETGALLAGGTEPAFAALSAAWRRSRQRVASPVLIVTAGPAFTAKWLAPRLYEFAQAHPEIDLRISASLRLMDFDRDDVDLAIRFGMPRAEPGLFSKPVMRDWVTPMMHPELAERYKTPEDLRHAPLLHQADVRFLNPPIDWQEWFRLAGLGQIPEGGATFSQADHAIDAATAKGGVVMARISLAMRDLEDGRLVAPFPLAVTTEAHNRFVCPEGSENRPEIRAFLDWVLDAVRPLEKYEVNRRFVPSGAAPPIRP